MGARSVADYARMLRSLLPEGWAWARERTALLSALLQGLACELARVDVSAHDLDREADPRSASLLLDEWERMLGLPDACSLSAQTLAERRAAVVLKLTATGGQSAAYYEALASAYSGLECAVREFQPFRAGISRAGDPLTNDPWTHVWELHAADQVQRVFTAGGGAAGEPLRSWGNETLECVIARLKPAHTRCLHTYGD
ncbi:MAG: putative phage tail protein [Desulfovibrionaceae bacterium]